MNKKEFLERITYTTHEGKKEIKVWYQNQILASLDFSDYPLQMEDNEYCTKLSEETALQSRLYKELVKNEK
jgi:hypothetical protein